MKILYGLQTTGHGHLVRSTPIVRRLRELGHEVDVLFSGPPPAALWRERVGPPFAVHPGLTFVAEAGRIRYLATARQAQPIRFLRDVFSVPPDGYDLFVTDYEPITAWLARRIGARSIGLGHLYAFAYPVPMARGNALTRAVLRRFAPATVAIGSHWHHFGQPLIPPFMAPDARWLSRTAIEEDLQLVYLGFEATRALVPLFRSLKRYRVRLYARVAAAEACGNVEIRPISRERFLEDLGRCHGVIANAGYTLASEALHLGIKLLVKPVRRQIEQESNAVALRQLGLAAVTEHLEPTVISAWLDAPPPAAQHYPDVTAAVTDYLHAGATESLEGLSARLWAASGQR